MYTPACVRAKGCVSRLTKTFYLRRAACGVGSPVLPSRRASATCKGGQAAQAKKIDREAQKAPLVAQVKIFDLKTDDDPGQLGWPELNILTWDKMCDPRSTRSPQGTMSDLLLKLLT